MTSQTSRSKTLLEGSGKQREPFAKSDIDDEDDNDDDNDDDDDDDDVEDADDNDDEKDKEELEEGQEEEYDDDRSIDDCVVVDHDDQSAKHPSVGSSPMRSRWLAMRTIWQRGKHERNNCRKTTQLSGKQGCVGCREALVRNVE